MFTMLTTVVILLAASWSVDGQVFGYSIHNSKFDCTGKEDGVAEIGCDGFLECAANMAVKHYCTDFQYFARDTMSCVNTSSNSSGCTEDSICHDLDDGRYADRQQNCQTYYTCHGHIFYGHQYCPAGLVFNDDYQVCDWATNVPFPCGTKPTATVSG